MSAPSVQNSLAAELRSVFPIFDKELETYNSETYNIVEGVVEKCLQKISNDVADSPELVDEDLALAVAEAGVRFSTGCLCNPAGNLLSELVILNPRTEEPVYEFLRKVITGEYRAPDCNVLRHDFIKDLMGKDYDPCTCKSSAVADAFSVAEKVFEASSTPPDMAFVRELTEAALRKTADSVLIFGQPLKPLRSLVARYPAYAEPVLGIVMQNVQDGDLSAAAQEIRTAVLIASGQKENPLVTFLNKSFAGYESVALAQDRASASLAARKDYQEALYSVTMTTMMDSRYADSKFIGSYVEAGLRYGDTQDCKIVCSGLERLVDERRLMAVSAIDFLKTVLRGEYAGVGAEPGAVLKNALNLTVAVVENFSSAADGELVDLLTDAALRITPGDTAVGNAPLDALGMVIGLNGRYADRAFARVRRAGVEAVLAENRSAIGAAKEVERVIFDAIAAPIDPKTAKERRMAAALTYFGLDAG
ncbi:MAG: hypothetical protein PHE27_05585 [Alphaproteobacteria bacterium]|nr:hypothetical protein [Alphaproteobacteria bacterium]